MKRFEITRAGFLQFKVWGPNHCGQVNYLRGGHIPVKYEVCLQATGALDEKGFLIDNMFIANFMKAAAAAGTDLSCELLLESLCVSLNDAMKEAEPSLEVLQFTMELSPDFGPGEKASMKYFFSADPGSK